MKLPGGKVKTALHEIINELDNAPGILADAARKAIEGIPEHIPKGGSPPSYPERGLIVYIAELYKKIHGDYPLRPTETYSNLRGTLDEIIDILSVIIEGQNLSGLIRDYDTQLKEKIKSQKKS